MIYFLGEIKDSEQLVVNIVESCAVNAPTPIKEKQTLLNQFLEIVKSGQVEYVKKHFK